MKHTNDNTCSLEQHFKQKSPVNDNELLNDSWSNGPQVTHVAAATGSVSREVQVGPVR